MGQRTLSEALPALLEVYGLDVDVAGERGPVPILHNISFALQPGSITGLFGESGCGKSTLALALLGLLPAPYRVRGSIRFGGRELSALDDRSFARLRGAAISLIFQDPLLALNPVMRIHRQIAEVLRAHARPYTVSDIEALLETAGLDPARVRRAWPHQLSGGERQRVAIAQALACRPPLVIADEPFTALDTVLAAKLAGLFQELRDRLGAAFLIVTHSPGVLARMAGQVLVMERGRIVEAGDPQAIFRRPAHPYTAALVRDLPRMPRGPSHVA